MKNSAKQGCENMEIKMTTTDTPRTDACPHCGAKPMIRSYVCGTTLPNINGDCYVSDLCHEREARQKAETEVEFWKSKAYEAEFHEGKHEAEVERLRGIVQAQLDELEAIDCALGTSEGHSAVDHIVPLRAEVERLREQLQQAVEIAEEMAGDNWPTEHPLYAELDSLKATLNPAD